MGHESFLEYFNCFWWVGGLKDLEGGSGLRMPHIVNKAKVQHFTKKKKSYLVCTAENTRVTRDLYFVQP